MRIYVASSWRNPFQQDVVKLLRVDGHEVYDFRNPGEGDTGFHWSEIDENWKAWDSPNFKKSLNHPVAEDGFDSDMLALEQCDACVLVLPCGRSAHLELGWACGAEKMTVIILPGTIGLEHAEKLNGHSMNSNVRCPTCGDLDGCHVPRTLEQIEPELMYKMVDLISHDTNEVREFLRVKK